MGRIANPYTRVTSVLSFVDSNWYQYWIKGLAKKCPNPVEEAERITRESADFGTAVHAIVEAYLKGETTDHLELTDRQKECGGTLINWLKAVGAEPLIIDGKPAVELEVKDDKLMLVGHFDAVVNIDKIPWILDFKTSSKMRKSYPLQKAAYVQMLKNQYGIEVNDGATLRVDRDPSVEKQFEPKEYHQLKEKYWPEFESCFRVYNYFNGKGDWAKVPKIK